MGYSGTEYQFDNGTFIVERVFSGTADSKNLVEESVLTKFRTSFDSAPGPWYNDDVSGRFF